MEKALGYYQRVMDVLFKVILTLAAIVVGLDVLSLEPPPAQNPIFKFKNVLLSPHNAFYTPEALESCADIVIGNIQSYIKGRPKNVPE